ncbi:MAG: helix-turn-helix transcriptional regulator [Clostridia bacterium]|nr:helix-turn-helix transcriptional regulator [Clostridia bacterium]
MFSFEKHAKDFDISIVNYAKWPSFNDIHYHDGYELYYLLNGDTKYITDNATYEIHKGDVVIIPPYVRHMTRPHNTERYKRILVNFSQAFLNDCLNRHSELTSFLSEPRVIRIDAQKQNGFRRTFNLLVEEHLSEFHDCNTAEKGLLLTCFVQLKRLYDKNIARDGNNTQEHYVPLPHQLQILINFIASNYAQQLTLEELSSQVHLNPVYVSSLFKKNLGYTFKEHLINVRLNASSKLLKNSDDSVEKIAFACGFNSCNHFCKTFKKHTGISPSTYRNSDKSDENLNTFI